MYFSIEAVDAERQRAFYGQPVGIIVLVSGDDLITVDQLDADDITFFETCFY